MVILDTIAPVFLVVALGACLQRYHLVPANFLKDANRLTFNVGMPALFFVQLAVGTPTIVGVKPLLGVLLAATVLTMVGAYGATRLLRVRGVAEGTFVQGAFRGNLAFVGLPIIFTMPDVTLVGGVSLHRAAVILVASMMLVYNIVAVVVLLAGQHRLGWAMFRPMLKQLVLTPPLVAILAGLFYAALGWHLPVFADRTLTALGTMALPLGLLGVGGALVTCKLAAGWRLPLVAALLRTALSPLLGWIFGRWWGLDPLGLKLVLVLLATPTAIISYTVTLALKGDDKLASAIIGISVLTSMVTLAIVVSGS